jgi:hypothetical protein
METDYLTRENQKWLITKPETLENVLTFRQNINQVVNDNIAQVGNENLHQMKYIYSVGQ